MYFTYVLKSHKDDKLYIGYTENLDKRILEHNSGKVKSTKYRIPFELVYYEACRNQADAGRLWNNQKVNLRDKVESKFNFSFNHTEEIIKAFEKNELPDKIMINIHPEHWASTNSEWFKIWVVRKIRNFGKRIFLGVRSKV